MNILIIEDETKTARELAKLIVQLRPECNILASLSSVAASLQWMQENKTPDLVFSDIQLADGTCFEIFKKVNLECPVIFCTAYDDYAIKAFETNGIAYLLKPFDEKKLEESIEKYDRLKKMLSLPGQGKQIEKTLQQISATYKNTLLIHFQEKIIPLRTTDIAFLYYNNSIVNIYTLTNQKYSIHQSLDELESILNPLHFFRANRQFIIQRSAIVNVEHYFTRRYAVRLVVATPETVVISKVKAPLFLNWIEQS